MAQIQSTLGNIRGKLGHVIIYRNQEGKNLMRSSGSNYKIKSAARKKSTTAFCTVAHCRQWLQEVIRLGFPGNNQIPKGNAGFMHANATAAVTVRREDSLTPAGSRSKLVKEYEGYVDPARFRIAAGCLEKPAITLDIDTAGRTLTFHNHGCVYDRIDCFTTDRLYAVAISFSTYSYQIIELGMRGADSETTVSLKPQIPAEEMAVYVFASKADGKTVSDSICLYSSRPDRKNEPDEIITEKFQ